MLRIVQTLLWEFFGRGWWRIGNALIALLGISVIVYSSLLRAGPIDPQAGRSLHFVLLWIFFVSSGSAILSTQGEPSRFFLLPLSNRTLAAVTMLPSMASIAVSYAITAGILNGWFGVGWPLWGPMLFLVVAFATIQTVRRITGPGRIAQFSVWCLVGFLFEHWLRARYGGGSFLHPQTMWTTVTRSQLVSMGAVVVIEFFIMIHSIARERRGDCALLSIRPSWPNLPRQARCHTRAQFRSAAAAQFWFEWKQKGLIVPSTFAAFATIVIVGYWLHWFRNGEYELLHLCLGYGQGLVPIALVAGMVLGHVDLPQAGAECESFLATRPTTTSALSTALLKVEAASLMLTWGLWVLGLSASTAILYFAQGSAPVNDLWTVHGALSPSFAAMGFWFVVPLIGMALISAWIPLSLMSSAVLTGRPRFLLSLAAAIVPDFLLLFFLGMAREEGRAILPAEVTQVFSGAIAGIGTFIVFAMARRHGLIPWATCGVALAGWLLLCVLWGLVSWQVGSWTLALGIHFFGWLSLPVASFAAAPLALSWNRHR